MKIKFQIEVHTRSGEVVKSIPLEDDVENVEKLIETCTNLKNLTHMKIPVEHENKSVQAVFHPDDISYWKFILFTDVGEIERLANEEN